MIQNREEFEGKRVIELGGGTGICGLVCSHFAKHTVITDYKVRKLTEYYIGCCT